MSGKPYTLKEMKIIVDYLTERNAYSEVKGRRMWLDFASTKLTTRSWQSLKETFRKRILPDLHNPYYNLTMEQINSFRQGCNVADKNKPKLDVHTISDDSSSHSTAEKHDDNEPTIKTEEDINAGEDTICSKITSKTRISSAETVILDHYETTEDIQRDLESPNIDKNIVVDKPKSLRDCITYTEPLTPLVQEVLDDFASEPESDEPQMQIVEITVSEKDNLANMEQISKSPSKSELRKSTESTVSADVAKNAKGLSADVVEEVLMSEIKDVNQSTKSKHSKNTRQDSVTVLGKATDKHEGSDEENISDSNNAAKKNGEETLQEAVLEILEDTGSANTNIVERNVSTNKIYPCTSEKDSQSHSNITPDSLLPNNPEGFGKRTSNESEKQTQKDSITIIESGEETDPTRSLRKRVALQDKPKSTDNKKKKVESNDTIKVNGSMTESKSDSTALTYNVEVKSNQNARSKSKSPVATKIIETKAIIEQPSTSKDHEEVMTVVTVEPENPCLKNLSLFDQQLSSLKYSSSSDEDIVPIPIESERVHGKDVKHTKTDKVVENKRGFSSKSRRDIALANAFGFSSGTTIKNTRTIDRRRNTHYDNGTNSSQSESDGELYVSAPRGPRNKQPKKYLKPQSAKILSLEEDGGLFVMHGKKIYPLVKDGNMVKSYVTYSPDSENEDEESYWKLKYIEEKKKTDELKRLLEQAKKSGSRKTRSPILPSKAPRNTHSTTNQLPVEPDIKDKEASPRAQVDKNESSATRPEEKIKIKFTRNNEEVHLEGHWPQIHPVLEQVVNIFHKESDASGLKAKEPERKTPQSGYSTPVIMIDPEVHETVNLKEKQIFEEIAERDKEEKGQTNQLSAPTTAQDTSPHSSETVSETTVTKRGRGRPRKTSSAAGSPAKKPKIARKSRTPEAQATEIPEEQNPVTPEAHTKIAEDTNKAKVDEAEKPVRTSARRIVTPKKLINETTTKENTAVQTRRSNSKTNKMAETKDEVQVRTRSRSRSAMAVEAETGDKVTVRTRSRSRSKMAVEAETGDEVTVRTRSTSRIDAETGDKVTVRTRSRSRSKRTVVETGENVTVRTRSRSGTNKSVMDNEDEVRYMFPSNVRQLSTKKTANEQKPQKSAENTDKIVLWTSLDSTQGYQDSDISPIRTDLRKKKLNNRSTYTIRNRSLLRRNSRRRSHPYLHFDASNDSSNSSTSAPMFTARNSSLDTEVYRSESYQLLMGRPTKPLILLDRIDEDGQTCDSKKYFSIPKEPGQIITDIASSSNVSLPLSPELSVVEHLSVSKEMLSSVGDPPTINETQFHQTQEPFCSKYLISGIDVSVPLMEQDCDLESCNMSEDQNSVRNFVTDSLLGQINTCRIRDQTPVTGMLNQKLENLLLESAKKIAEGMSNHKMDVDNTDVAETKSQRKRCSTPRKRIGTKKSAASTVAVIEEEHTEACAFNGRNSCPPVLQAVQENNDLFQQINIDNLNINPEAKKTTQPRKKKDVIKVKIQRPKSSNDKSKPMSKSKISVCTDSGINDSASSEFLQVDDSVDLIHNHSDTCLHANECVGDSVEFVNNSNSIISLTDSSEWRDPAAEFADASSAETNIVFHDNAVHDTSETVYHSPLCTELSNNSLITEDLSDEVQRPPSGNSNWFLFTEDENTNTQHRVPERISSASSSGANLKQIFPEICTIPDLSTITEMSKENDDSRKPMLDTDTDTRDDLNSLGASDSNF